jgi:hypothetical protein
VLVLHSHDNSHVSEKWHPTKGKQEIKHLSTLEQLFFNFPQPKRPFIVSHSTPLPVNEHLRYPATRFADWSFGRLVAFLADTEDIQTHGVRSQFYRHRSPNQQIGN